MRNKQYTPKKNYNPVVLSQRLELLEEKVQLHKHLLDCVNKANDLHVEHLSNFVRHDMKNAVQGLDGIIYNAKNEQRIPKDFIEQLEASLLLLRTSLDNFASLIPSSTEQKTSVPKVLNAVELLTRGEMQKYHIDMKFDYDRQSDMVMHCPFQSIFQIIHNLTINAKNAVADLSSGKILVKGDIEGNICIFKVYDNGKRISEDEKAKIFKYGYSTTGGTGIGLFHANYVAEKINAQIDILPSDIPCYTKYFIITISL